eukprot:NODE_5727_length_391_cov_55.154971_g5028_i0.p4 GENE.NODE_5727_length_391_cov_55.154971_g5028_i0~~NODE_5727_length_391_cov_55.154971_g5028_i0.p4  ORF type:complete len:63 (-),score=18.16 NODE_5727_length_391_cov_55.154971_g5028_i0:162-350(-)
MYIGRRSVLCPDPRQNCNKTYVQPRTYTTHNTQHTTHNTQHTTHNTQHTPTQPNATHTHTRG